MDARKCTSVKYHIHSYLGSKNIYSYLSSKKQIANVHFLRLKLQPTLCDLYLSVPNALIYRVFQGKSLHNTQSSLCLIIPIAGFKYSCNCLQQSINIRYKYAIYPQQSERGLWRNG